MIHNILAIILGLYVMIEAVHQMADMDGGDRACRVAKYVLSALSGLLLAWYGIQMQLDWLHVSLAASVALFVWPKLLGRLYVFFGHERRKLERRS
jgi:hypothetical protein